MNSDVTAVFLDILPRLAPGVIVGIHDINLPYDYEPASAHRYYSEQYLLAAYLLAEGEHAELLLPCRFISGDEPLRRILTPLWSGLLLSGCVTPSPAVLFHPFGDSANSIPGRSARFDPCGATARGARR